MEQGQGMRKRWVSRGVPEGTVAGKGAYGVGRKEPPKWQTSPPIKTNVLGPVRARPEICPTACCVDRCFR